jgi:hypothetical protein
MQEYLLSTLFQISNEQRLRATHILNEIVVQNKNFLSFVQNKLKNRWNILNEIFSKQTK